MWIYENKQWPNFTWQIEALANKLADIRHQQGRLLGYMEHLGFQLKGEANLTTLTEDILKSSAIEGEHLDSAEVRSSVARQLGIDAGGLIHTSRNIDGIVEMMLDATQQFAAPLTQERLCNWHAALFPTGRSGMHWIATGSWRAAATDPMQVISGHKGREIVHFEAPAATRLNHEMALFLAWFNQNNQNIDPILKAGIAHLWFVTIHPFEDGNGRIGRAICDMALARADLISERFYSLSSQIAAERKQYYMELEYQQRHTTDLTSWLTWFLDCLGRALTAAEKNLRHIIFKAKLWQWINTQPVNDRQQLIINKMLDQTFEGFMNTSKYAKLSKCSTDTALRDIQQLKARGIFLQNNGGGRSTSYRLTDSLPH